MRLFHVLGTLVAVGGVISSYFLFFIVAIKPKFATTMSKAAPVISFQIWVGLFVIGITGIFLLQGRPWVVDSLFFQIKKILIVVVVLNGFFLNLYITPKMKELAPEWPERTDRVKKFEKIAGVSGVISVIGWLGVEVISILFL